MRPDIRYQAFMGLAPKQIPMWENWSCPDAETFITGIDYYEHPRLCRMRMRELYPMLAAGATGLEVPATDDPKPRPPTDFTNGQAVTDTKGMHHVRWGDSITAEWDWGKDFDTIDQVLAFSPLENADFRGKPVISALDFRSEDALYNFYRPLYPAEWTGPQPGDGTFAFFYNTLFMWPMLTFGWEKFLEVCLLPEFDRIMDEFAEISRRVFKTFAKLPVNFVVCHDDIVNPRGLICSPAWMRKHIYPRYEEFWSIVKSAGKEVIFMTDGNADPIADDVMACGARGFVTEGFTDFKALARRYENIVLVGEGDNRVLSRNRPDEIRAMVDSMLETARMTGGYFMSIGNHIPWNLPPAAVKLYLDLIHEKSFR